MSSLPERLNTALGGASSTSVWVRRFLIVLTVLGCMVIVGIVFWFLAILIHPILLLFIGVVIAYLLYPLSRSLGRHMPHALAILLTYGIVAAVLFLASYFMLLGALSQLNALVHSIQVFFQNYQAGKYPQLTSSLDSIGLTPSVIESSQQKLVASLQALIGQIFPLVGSIFAFFIDVSVVTTVSIYLMVDGPRVIEWLTKRTPAKHRARVGFFLATVDQTAGGYIRGQILLATIMSVIVMIGAFVIGVPYVALIGLIVFVFEFIPQIGAYISGALGFLIALTAGWQTALIYLTFVTIVQAILDGQVLAPRILGHSVGIHPVTSLFFVFVFGTLFGLWGAFLCAPIVGIIQVYVVTSWKAWEQRDPEQFPEVETEKKDALDGPAIGGPGLGVVET